MWAIGLVVTFVLGIFAQSQVNVVNYIFPNFPTESRPPTITVTTSGQITTVIITGPGQPNHAVFVAGKNLTFVAAPRVGPSMGFWQAKISGFSIVSVSDGNTACVNGGYQCWIAFSNGPCVDIPNSIYCGFSQASGCNPNTSCTFTDIPQNLQISGVANAYVGILGKMTDIFQVSVSRA